MLQNNIPPYLKERLREYFHSSRSMQREQHFHQLLLSMSPGLRGEVSIHNHRWINQIHFFRSDDPVEEHDFITEVYIFYRLI